MRATVVAALVGGMLTVASNEIAGADPAPSDTLSTISGANQILSDSVDCKSLPERQLCGPSGAATDSSGNVYVTDSGHDEVVKYTLNSANSTYTAAVIAGNDTRSAPIQGPALASPLNEPGGIAVYAGNVFVADTQNNVIEKIGTDGNLSIVAGNGSQGPTLASDYSGAATSTSVTTPQGLAVDQQGNLYVSTGLQILRIATGGMLTVIAGTGATGAPVFGGPATASPLNNVASIAVSTAGVVYFTDKNDAQGTSTAFSYVEQISGGVLQKVAGGPTGSPTPGLASASALSSPAGVAVDKFGNIFIVETQGYRVDKIDPDGTLSVIAGDGAEGLPTSGPASSSQLYQPFGIAIDPTSSDPSLYVTNSSHAGQLLKIALVADPSKINLSATAGNATISLKFDAPDPGYTKLAGYQISTDGGSSWSTLPTSGLGGTQILSLSGINGQSYLLAVRAINEGGATGPASNVVTVTPAAPFTPPAPVVVPPAPVAPPAPVVVPIAPAKVAAPWFKDPLSAAQRRTEIAVPRSPASYRGPIKWTVATDKSRNGTVAIPVLSIRGRQLLARQAATLSGDNLFRGNTATLTGAALVQLRSLVTSLKGTNSIVCEAYTDYAGNGKQLQTLSAKRALAVCTALRAGGAKVRFTAVGYGMYRPVILGGTTANRAANRRIVVLVTS